jgi:SAM-dependent methyltransferase
MSADVRRAAQAAAFDRIGDRYDEAFPHKAGQVAAGEWLVSRLAPGSRVLDVGCGTGLPTLRDLAGAGMRVTGMDISPVMLGLARQNVPEADLRLLDVSGITPELGAFDGAVAFFSLLMLPRAEIPAALRAIRVALRPGAPFALGMVEADLDYVPISFLGAEIRVTGYPRDQLREVVTAAGFSIVGEHALDYAPVAPGRPPETQLFVTALAGGGPEPG